ncbi:TPA: thioredoxin-disulfide reductase [Patescibacteria group bacterium]|jgi:thioredoxin reductase (NADPH)|nr:thioredoxin-disulfide reductase [Patescibacteria group bacterium]
MEKIYNTIIIGSGPAGLTAALYAGRAEIEPLVIAGLQPGGQLTITTDVENFPGFPEGIQGPELVANMTKQAERFGAKIAYENVAGVDFSQKPFKVKTDGNEYQAKSVIIATGAEVKWLGLENETRLRGKGVTACATCDGFFFKDLDIVVIGGGDSAMEEALFLTKFGKSVTIVHRRDEFKASKIMLKRAQDHPKISFITDVTVVDILGEDSFSGIRIKDNKTGEERDVAAKGYFVAIGHTPASKVFQEAGIEVDAKGYVIPKEFTQTNIEGVFVAGDVHDHRYRQAITAAGEGCKAALDVEKYLTEKAQE